MSLEQMTTFFEQALAATVKKDPIIESGNKYAVSEEFHRMNGKLLMAQATADPRFLALREQDQVRLRGFFDIIFTSKHLRCRNPLHPAVVDTCVLGNLMNFPKHIFGFPFASYGTNGAESLSLVLYSYRQLAGEGDVVWLVSDSEPDTVLLNCAERLGMTIKHSSAPPTQGTGIAVVLAALESSTLGSTCDWAVAHSLPVHVHVSDSQWRGVFKKHKQAVHWDLPEAVRSVSIQEGLLHSGYSLYRDLHTRDLHFDLGYEWCTVYLSPNEGGSGTSTPLWIDFCYVMLGWTALHHMSTHSTQHSILPALVPTHVPTSAGGQFERVVEEVLGPLAATEQDLNQVWSGLEARASDIFSAADQSDDDLLSKAELKRHLKRDADCAALVRTGGFKTLWEDLDSDSDGRISRAEFVQHYCRAFKEAGFQAVQEWAQGAMHDSALSHSQLETLLAGFECKFLGGQGRELELITTGGGTRSINLALECVLAGSTGPAKILTGNPHLAVERAERRFGFQLVRLVEGGRLSVSALRQHIADPQVVAVYSQSLSYTDGISDQLQEIFQVVEEQNLVRASNSTPLVTLINDSCLALSALVHNDGVDGRASLRVLDLSRDGITPVLVTLDAHKHLGTDKGLSTVIGTPNTLSRLTGRLPVGVQPGRAVLVAALADMLLIGADGYHTLYHQLAGEVEKAAQAITAAGMTVVHAEGKMPGSTVLAVEDSSGIMTRRLKKKGHSFAYLYNLYPEDPDRCQTGWSLSLTHNSLRELPGGATALDTFVGDLVQVHKSLGVGPCWAHKLWKENSLLGILASGGLVDSWLFGLLWKPGARRSIAEMVIRRFFSAILDSGVVRSNKRTQALKIFLARTAILAMLLLAVLSRRVGGRAALLLGAAVTTVVR
eukprot:TRINITY_DN1760_c0_g1_i7.p1 TRINITY_DN1760_c0_g1~~TRINITY_DN1760_c0_g1_i7.p1  ORF type:complete len:890 (+),score=259.59 TRINITY_DN1760_c0_g1_i7:363-3032(+)